METLPRGTRASGGSRPYMTGDAARGAKLLPVAAAASSAADNATSGSGYLPAGGTYVSYWEPATAGTAGAAGDGVGPADLRRGTTADAARLAGDCVSSTISTQRLITSF